MSMSELEKLNRKRGTIKSRLTRFTKYVEELRANNARQDNDYILLQSKFDKLDMILSDFNGVQNQILDLLDDDLDSHEQENADFEEKFFTAHALALGILRSSAPANAETSMLSANSAHATPIIAKSNKAMKPAINLPTFDGSFDKWYHFRDLFKSMIHSDDSLSNVEKLHYLNICLKGAAASILNSVSISDDNYAVAWDLLNERFENKQFIVHSHIQGLFNINSIKRDSYKSLRELLDNLNWHWRSLERLGLPVKSWDALIIYLISSKLDASSRREWDAETSGDINVLPTLDELKSFLNKRCRQLEKSNADIDTRSNSKIKTNSLISTGHANCNHCGKTHFISKCDSFLKLSTNNRINAARKGNLCLNCLGRGHNISSCRSKYSCNRCNKKHHSLLHIDEKVTPIDKNTNTSPSTSNATVVTHLASSEISQILLSTVSFRVADISGVWHTCRAILDNGSQSNLITNKFLKKLRLPRLPAQATVSGISNNTINIRHKVEVCVRSNCTSFEVTLNCLVIDKITENMPMVSFDSSFLKIPSNITLADPTFNQEGEIDMLLGASIFWQLLCIGQLRLGDNCPILQKTRLGWILSGPLPCVESQPRNRVTCHLNVDKQLERFWELEECDSKKILSPREQEAEISFINTTTRDQTGRFTVAIPFSRDKQCLGASRQLALKRFFANEKRLNQNLDLKLDYITFMNEYENLGHMKLVLENSNESEHESYYLPHHAVIKASSTTTKTRVVFDGSARTTTGVSLNDIQHTGAALQDDILSLLLRFRQHAFVMTADIEKMYRQVLLSEADRKYHRILWRSDSSEDIRCYELQTITYGTASASFLATRCLKQLAIDYSVQFPQASNIIRQDFYVDDLLTGTNSIEKLERLKDDIVYILRSAGFNLRKWLSNTSIPFESANESEHLKLCDDSESRTLGISWNSRLDLLKYEIAHLPPPKHVTKRTILSTTAKIFDPLGLLGPVIIVAKLIMQRLWECKLSWDESIPQDLHSNWIKFINEVSSPVIYNIPRYAWQLHSHIIECHGFSDASERAYGACVYVRCVNSNGQYSANLLCAKSRVAPLRQVSLPRLELCAAALLVNLIAKIREAITINFTSYYFWSDSTITLGWIKSPPSRWQTFVANRVALIQTHSKPQDWFHVRSQDNPADLLSRGASSSALSDNSLWWHGPNWLFKDSDEWPNENQRSVIPDTLPEARKTSLTANVVECDLFHKFSSLSKLQRITAWSTRFIYNCRKPRCERLFGPLQSTELDSALLKLVKIAQLQAFPTYIKKLKLGEEQKCNNDLIGLSPFIDNNGILRVGGRISQANFSFNKKHPIILPKNHVLTDLIIMHEHKVLLHGGAQTVLCSLRERFWPISGKCRIKRLIRTCVTCFKAKPVSNQYIMGNLPTDRITPVGVFQKCGVDYAGPFMLKNKNSRGTKSYKGYICLFVCMVTKAVHLELVSSLTTEAFLATLRRFISRRGKPSDIYSDNATNFIGADREIRALIQIMKCADIQNFNAEQGINWHFIPPRSPNFGGLWEAGIKSTKSHLRRVLGVASLTFEDFTTVLTQIEAVLNSRPLSSISNDPNDLNPLTPGHFLIGRPVTALPQHEALKLPDNRLSAYQRLQKLTQHYWSRWSKEYVNELQIRCRWKNSKQSLLTKGSLVIIREDNLPPCHWRLGRVLEVHPGSDGVIRVVTVKTISGIVKRCATKMCVLPIYTD